MHKENKELYEFDKFRLDVSERFLLKSGKRVALTDRAFDTLCVLVKRGNHLTSKDELMTEVWADAIVEENNLDKNISALRQILGEKKGKQKFIETVRGRGYRFVAEVRRVEQSEPPAVISGLAFKTAASAETLKIQSKNSTDNLAPLIGRETETAELEDLLRSESVRLVTMTGVGGTGKTRLAQSVAQRLLAELLDGVFFVELAAVTQPELVASSIAQPLDLKEAGGKPIADVLKDYLREKEMLLVVDNFEQVADAAPLVAELLAAADKLKILITSRALLHLSREREFAVPPLTAPPEAAQHEQRSMAELSNYEAVRLFVERAQNVKPNFRLTDENAESVAEICARLDGLPLAIEFAAARVKTLAPSEILSKLRNRLKLLTGGARDLPARHQTMRGAIEWSYDLLAEEEKNAFRRLAVFAGGFTLEAAEAVCGSVQSPNFSLPLAEKEHAQAWTLTIDVLDLLTSLLDKSLLVAKEQRSGTTRFRMLETVREYALESLEKSGEADERRRRHAAYFLALGEAAEPHLKAAQSAEWFDRLEEERDNLRAALRWSLERDAETAVRLTVGIQYVWILHGHHAEGRKWVESALHLCGESLGLARWKLLSAAGILARMRGDFQSSRKLFEENLTIAKVLKDKYLIAMSSRNLGISAEKQNDNSEARKFFNESLVLGKEINNKKIIGMSLTSLGDIARIENDYETALPLYEEALALFEEKGFMVGIISTLNNLGVVVYHQENYQTAFLHYTEALKAGRKLGFKVLISDSLHGFAALAVERGEQERAARLAGAAEHLRESIGYEIEPADRRFRDAYLSKLRAALSETEFAAACEQGRKLKLDEAIALALSETDSSETNFETTRDAGNQVQTAASPRRFTPQAGILKAVRIR